MLGIRFGFETHGLDQLNFRVADRQGKTSDRTAKGVLAEKFDEPLPKAFSWHTPYLRFTIEPCGDDQFSAKIDRIPWANQDTHVDSPHDKNPFILLRSFCQSKQQIDDRPDLFANRIMNELAFSDVLGRQPFNWQTHQPLNENPDQHFHRVQ